MFDDLRDPQPPEDEGEGADFLPEDDPLLADLPGFDEPFDEPAEEPTVPHFDAGPRFGDNIAEPTLRPARARQPFLGMTPQQRAVLSIFLFLDVSVLGCVLLIAAGAVSIP